MPVIEEISESLVRENIVRAVADVCDEMLRRPIALRDSAEPWPPWPAARPEAATQQVVCTVGFLGEAKGLIHIYFDSSFAVDCAGMMLGMAGPELSGIADVVVNFAVGELTGMIVEIFKDGLCEAGFPCGLTESSILRGLNFRIDPISTAQRYIYVFDCSGRRIVADILIAGKPSPRPGRSL